jgi:hypothetical protein
MNDPMYMQHVQVDELKEILERPAQSFASLYQAERFV